ncbi:hypothetical protein EG878_14810 [Enterococcus faecalis]|nr:hypothetical protein EG878_14810 [Enterococcus faecalis]
MSKRALQAEIQDQIETLERVVDNINEGNIGFSEAGDYLHTAGYDIISLLERASDALGEE